MVERKTDLTKLVGAMNLELLEELDRWKSTPYSGECIVKLNTIFGLAEKAGLTMTLEVEKEAILGKGDDFVRILPRESEIYGKEQADSWVFNIPPLVDNPGSEPYILSITGACVLSYYHMHYGEIARFRPSDILSVRLE